MLKNIFLNKRSLFFSTGHEQKGKRPAIVVSHDVFNEYTKMAIVCPVTCNDKYFPTHYILEDTKKYIWCGTL